jgi:protocatechuate 3,4-dioxygenase beta subunit
LSGYKETDMDRDDAPVGYVVTRREALLLLGAAGITFLTPGIPRLPHGRRIACVARPQQTEGPYFVDERLHRSDITSDPTNGVIKPGTPLDLSFTVSRLAGASCTPLAGAMVDVWHCDHLGIYSDVRDPSFDTSGQKFLRGYQVTDPQGVAHFKTIYPGWYQGRAVHIHFKIRSAPEANPGFEFTSQIYFDEAINDRVFARQPYAAKSGTRVPNERDGIYRRGGRELTVKPDARDGGYVAAFDIALA